MKNKDEVPERGLSSAATSVPSIAGWNTDIAIGHQSSSSILNEDHEYNFLTELQYLHCYNIYWTIFTVNVDPITSRRLACSCSVSVLSGFNRSVCLTQAYSRYPFSVAESLQ